MYPIGWSFVALKIGGYAVLNEVNMAYRGNFLGVPATFTINQIYLSQIIVITGSLNVYPTGYGVSKDPLNFFEVDFVPSCYEIFDLEPLSFDFEFLRSFNLASSLADHHAHTSFGRHLEEKHVTWTQAFGRHLGRNGTRLPLYTKMIKMWHTVCGDGITIPCDEVKVFKRRRQDL
ncbi:hypothetical protein Tco_0155363 [Tanacetum coccineum]